MSLPRSWLWKCISGSRSDSEMHRNAPAAKASARPTTASCAEPSHWIPTNAASAVSGTTRAKPKFAAVRARAPCPAARIIPTME